VDSELLLIADAVVQTLNAANLTPNFTAQRVYQPSFELPEMKTLQVTVVPKEQEHKRLTRARFIRICRVDVGVQQKFEKGNAAELDPLVRLVRDIAALFEGQPLSGIPETFCLSVKIEPVFAQEHFEQLRQFTSVLTLTFKVWG
jgi:hypothetical protein